jgi:hypothetical protein
MDSFILGGHKVIEMHGLFLEGVYEIELDTKTEYEEF